MFNGNLCFVSDLIHCTNEMNVNIPQLADSLFERTTNTSWVVVFKSLITTQHLMVYGNEVTLLSMHRQTISPLMCYLLGVWCCFVNLSPLPHSGLSSTWPQGIHYSTSVTFWTKVGYKVTIWFWLLLIVVLSYSEMMLCFLKYMFLLLFHCRLWHVHIYQEV